MGLAEVAAAVVAVTVVSMILGLLISSLISNADRGMPLLVLVVMAQLVLCGGMFAVKDRIPLEQLAWLSPSRWAYAMAGSSLGVNYIRLTDTDPLWDHDRARWLTASRYVCGSRSRDGDPARAAATATRSASQSPQVGRASRVIVRFADTCAPVSTPNSRSGQATTAGLG